MRALAQRLLLATTIILVCFRSFIAASPITGDKNVVLLDITLNNGTTIRQVELPSSYCWISKVIVDERDEFSADIIRKL